MAVSNQGVPPFVRHYWTLEMPWNVLRNWFGDGSNFSLMAPKSYRGIVATPSHHHRITLNMFLHAARSLVLTFSYTLFIENHQERHFSNLFAPYVVLAHGTKCFSKNKKANICMLLNQILFIVYWWIVVNATLQVPHGSIDFIMAPNVYQGCSYHHALCSSWLRSVLPCKGLLVYHNLNSNYVE